MELENEKKYCGYKSIASDDFSVKDLELLRSFLAQNWDYLCAKNNNIVTEAGHADYIPLDEVRKSTIEFYKKHFKINNINYFDTSIYNKEFENYVACSRTSEEAYDKVNLKLQSISPFDLPIILVKGHSLVGEVDKPIVTVNDLYSPNRKIYFSNIDLGNQLSTASISCLTHEIAHTQQEQNIGYTDDLLNKEIISIFLEKVSASEIEDNGKTLKLVEGVRSIDLIDKYSDLLFGKNIPTEKDLIDRLIYTKSILYANKLFDMYQDEDKQKHRDQYFYDIQNVFDGRIQVEDVIEKRHITTHDAQNKHVLTKHL